MLANNHESVMLQRMTDSVDKLPHLPHIALFDWDNTLVENWQAVAIAINAARAHFNLEIWDDLRLRREVKKSMRDNFPLWFGDQWHVARDIFRDTFDKHRRQHLRVLDDAEALLKALQQKQVQMGVVSNKSGHFLRDEVAQLGWQKYFGAVIGAGDAAADKPDPAPAIMALEQMQFKQDPDKSKANKNNIWFIGDTDVDMDTAIAAHCQGILVGNYESETGETLAHSVPRFLTLSTLLILVKQLDKPIYL